MKKLLLILLIVPWCALAKDTDVDITLATTSGTVAARAKSVTFIFSSDFVGTVKGVAFTGAADSSITLNTPQPGDVLSSIAYTVTAGSVRIVRTQ